MVTNNVYLGRRESLRAPSRSKSYTWILSYNPMLNRKLKNQIKTYSGAIPEHARKSAASLQYVCRLGCRIAPYSAQIFFFQNYFFSKIIWPLYYNDSNPYNSSFFKITDFRQLTSERFRGDTATVVKHPATLPKSRIFFFVPKTPKNHF